MLGSSGSLRLQLCPFGIQKAAGRYVRCRGAENLTIISACIHKREPVRLFSRSSIPCTSLLAIAKTWGGIPVILQIKMHCSLDKPWQYMLAITHLIIDCRFLLWRGRFCSSLHCCSKLTKAHHLLDEGISINLFKPEVGQVEWTHWSSLALLCSTSSFTLRSICSQKAHQTILSSMRRLNVEVIPSPRLSKRHQLQKIGLLPFTCLDICSHTYSKHIGEETLIN